MRSVSCDARYLMLYLLTSPHRNMLGFYFLPLPYACFDLGWDEHHLRQGLHELMQAGRIKYDERAHVVLVQNYIKHNPFENPNQVKGAVDRLEVIPHTPLLRDLLSLPHAGGGVSEGITQLLNLLMSSPRGWGCFCPVVLYG